MRRIALDGICNKTLMDGDRRVAELKEIFSAGYKNQVRVHRCQREAGPMRFILDFAVTKIPPRIVRIQLMHSTDQTVAFQPLIIMRHIFRALRVGERASDMQVFFLTKFCHIFRTLPLMLILATYRYAISEDPEFITSNHDERHGSRGEESTAAAARLDNAKAILYAQPIFTGNMMDGRREVAIVNQSIRERRCLGKEMETVSSEYITGVIYTHDFRQIRCRRKTQIFGEGGAADEEAPECSGNHSRILAVI
ncbi:hypothetical protein IW262DRAFT_508328 [Armillaria fumosa]|nr:hypothetical protein IW262DRAFT_508328 [Armillaria fumosa]